MQGIATSCPATISRGTELAILGYSLGILSFKAASHSFGYDSAAGIAPACATGTFLPAILNVCISSLDTPSIVSLQVNLFCHVEAKILARTPRDAFSR
jgi:hypothetical protein